MRLFFDIRWGLLYFECGLQLVLIATQRTQGVWGLRVGCAARLRTGFWFVLLSCCCTPISDGLSPRIHTSRIAKRCSAIWSQLSLSSLSASSWSWFLWFPWNRRVSKIHLIMSCANQRKVCFLSGWASRWMWSTSSFGCLATSTLQKLLLGAVELATPILANFRLIGSEL